MIPRAKTACRGDGLLGGFGEGVGLHPHGPVQLAPAQDLDQAVLVHEALGPEGVGVDVVALEALEGVEIDHRVLDPERVLEALELGDPAGERHLATLEPDGDRAASGLALHASAGGLAALPADAATDTAPLLGRPLRRLEIMRFHLASTSSTSIRCGTLAIIPRISGRSGRTLL